MTIKGYTKFIYEDKLCEIIPMYNKRCMMTGYKIIIGDDVREVNGYKTMTIITSEYFNIIFKFHDGMKELKISNVRKEEGGML